MFACISNIHFHLTFESGSMLYFKNLTLLIKFKYYVY